LKTARVLLITCLLSSAVWAADRPVAHPPDEYPLLELARSLEVTRKPRAPLDLNAPDLRQAEHALRQANAPADENCARSLGALVFAELHSDVGQARKAKGDIAGAIQAYRRAQACAPRNTRVLASLADALFDSRDVAAAQEVVTAALAINPRGVYLTRVAASIDFVEERWAAAVAGFRYVAASEPDRVRAAYGQLMYWLAQARAGVKQPEFVARRHTDGWPRPLLLYMQGQYSETELVTAVQEDYGEAGVGPDERLCEALYYVGESYWARGQPQVARDYFAAMVNIKVIHYVEHGLALAEIAKLARLANPQND
jgi:lipoprotein NlpI